MELIVPKGTCPFLLRIWLFGVVLGFVVGGYNNAFLAQQKVLAPLSGLDLALLCVLGLFVYQY
jgi:hypothetical protein